MKLNCFNWFEHLETVEFLKNSWKAGDSAATIARNINEQYHCLLTRNAILGKIHRLGMSTTCPKKNPKTSSRARYRRAGRTMPYDQNPNSKLWRRARGLVTELAPETSANPMNILEIQQGQCRWPISGEGLGIMFCGNPTFERQSYCAHHCCIAFNTRGGMSLAEREQHRRKLVAEHRRQSAA